jgi:acyl-CoA thioesterase-2
MPDAPADLTDLATPDRAQLSGTELVESLDLDQLGADHYRGCCPEVGWPHLFGGHVLAQGLIAAARTVDAGKSAHSLHAYFLRAGDPRQPVDYVVTRLRDGRRLSARSVSALQDGKPIAMLITSFAATTGAIAHQVPAPDCPGPDELPTFSEAAQAWGGLGPSWIGFEAIDVKVRPHQTEPGPDGRASAAESADFIWQRVADPIPDDRVLHTALLVYMSDMMLMAAAVVPHGVPLGQEDLGDRLWGGLSLDHAIWFHRPVVADDWLLFAQNSPFAADGRALSEARVFDRSGRLIASTGQEGLIFEIEPAPTI